jgi:hypothetical protein
MKQRAKSLAVAPVMLLVVLCTAQCRGKGEGSLPGEEVDSLAGSCNVPFVDVMHHNFADFSTETFQVIDNSDDWCALWDAMTGDTTAASCDRTLVDFTREVAILVANPNAIWEDITCIQGDAFSARVRVSVEEAYLSRPGCILFFRPVNAVHVVKVQRVPVVATFKKTLIDQCPKE